MANIQRRKTVTASIGQVRVGSDAPVVVQSMTNTDTADAEATIKQVYELWQAGSEVVRITVNSPEAAAQVAEAVREGRHVSQHAQVEPLAAVVHDLLVA